MRPFIWLALLLCGCVRASAPPKAATVDNASQAVFNGNYATARTLYTAIARTTSDPKEREDVEIALANIEWRIERNADAARVRLQALGTRRALFEQSRMERDYGNYAAAEAMARKAIPPAQNSRELKSAQLALVGAIVESHLEARLTHSAPPDSDLREAFAVVRRIVDEDSGRLRPSLLYLNAALMLGEGSAALDAWSSYVGSTAQSALLAPAAETLERLLPQWRGGQSAEIANALAASRFFDQAVLVGAAGDTVAWASYLRRVREATNAYYRDVANGRGDAGAYRRELTKLTLETCRVLKVACNDKTLEGKTDTPLYFRFGAVIDAGDRGGTFNLHFGHVVLDEKREVIQYGRVATIRFILLEAMVSNGFES